MMRQAILFSLLWLPFAVWGQTAAPIKFQKLQDSVRFLISADIDKAFMLAHNISESKSHSQRCFANAALSYIYQVKGDTLHADQYLKLAYRSLDQIPPSDNKTMLKATVLNFDGLINWRRKRFNKALQKYEKGKENANLIRDRKLLLKFNGNISLIHEEIGDFRKAITVARQSDSIITRIPHLYSKKQFQLYKSNFALQLGYLYENFYHQKQRRVFLDSAQHYYERAILFSANIIGNKIKAKGNLANIFLIKGEYAAAEKVYVSSIEYFSKLAAPQDYKNLCYNLGALYYNTAKYDKALVCFRKADSIHSAGPIADVASVNGSYYQAKIYDLQGDADKALAFSERYLKDYIQYETHIQDQLVRINNAQQKREFAAEMDSIRAKYSFKNAMRKMAYIIIGLIVCGLLYLLVITLRDKKRSVLKFNMLLQEFKEQQGSNPVETDEQSIEQSVKSVPILCMDEDKENRILNKIALLEQKQYYLNPDFTLQHLAKKIKTNTTYLSYVINKRFGKSFSEYSNELRINYAIDQLINNPVYRKYSTQAIAESVGYKNAVSFTKSFSKRTGLTPTQFTKRLASEKLTTL